MSNSNLGCVDYRPQWFYPTPRGSRDQFFAYFYDLANAAYHSVPASSTVENIPLALETGSKFMWRGVRLNIDGGPSGLPTTLLVRFTGPLGNALSADWVPVTQYANPSGSACGAVPVPWEPEIECPSGSLILVSFKNLDAVSAVTLPDVTLYGMKRYEEGR